MTGRPASFNCVRAGGSRVGLGMSRRPVASRSPQRSPGAPARPRGPAAPARAARGGTLDAARRVEGTGDRGAATRPGLVADFADRGRRRDPPVRPRPPLAAAQQPTFGRDTPHRCGSAPGRGRRDRADRAIVCGFSLPRVEPPMILTRCRQCLYPRPDVGRRGPAGRTPRARPSWGNWWCRCSGVDRSRGGHLLFPRTAPTGITRPVLPRRVGLLRDVRQLRVDHNI